MVLHLTNQCSTSRAPFHISVQWKFLGKKLNIQLESGDMYLIELAQRFLLRYR